MNILELEAGQPLELRHHRHLVSLHVVVIVPDSEMVLNPVYFKVLSHTPTVRDLTVNAIF